MKRVAQSKAKSTTRPRAKRTKPLLIKWPCDCNSSCKAQLFVRVTQDEVLLGGRYSEGTSLIERRIARSEAVRLLRGGRVQYDNGPYHVTLSRGHNGCYHVGCRTFSCDVVERVAKALGVKRIVTARCKDDV